MGEPGGDRRRWNPIRGDQTLEGAPVNTKRKNVTGAELRPEKLETMKNISREDFIMWDNLKDEPIENFDTVYHFTSIVELVNTGGVVLREGQELRCVAELSKKWQKVISDAIEKTK